MAGSADLFAVGLSPFLSNSTATQTALPLKFRASG
jgi:hypothetical protein